MLEDWQDAGFGLYIHWPFCQAKCPYCDFNSHVARSIDQNRWRDAYLREIKRSAAETQGRVVRSIFFGGGTPSLMDPDLVGDILTCVGQNWTLANDVEITLEANPTSVEAGRFRGFRDSGVNRISMGLQALNDVDLRRLGRLHSVAEGIRAFDTARDLFARVSFDLIYARQDQSLADWRNELDRALSLAVDHLSLYQLTIESGTAFGDRFVKGGLLGLPNEDLAADMYDLTQDRCANAGFETYEVSNHAKPGQRSRHNLIYWQSGDYVGIGPGAHGRLTLNGHRYSTETALMPQHWLDQVTRAGTGETQRAHLTADESLSEFLLMGLRLHDGVSIQRLNDRGGERLDEQIKTLIGEGWLEMHDGHLRTTQAGRPVLNAVLRRLLED